MLKEITPRIASACTRSPAARRHRLDPGADASLRCKVGPLTIVFEHFASRQALYGQYNEALRFAQGTGPTRGSGAGCPRATEGPWNFSGSPKVVRGRVACYHYQGRSPSFFVGWAAVLQQTYDDPRVFVFMDRWDAKPQDAALYRFWTQGLFGGHHEVQRPAAGG